MQITVSRQSQKIRPDGTVVYKGEDARPYADGHILLVADGLGGAAAIRHRSFVPALFDPEAVYDALFGGLYDASCERLTDYVKESFYELRAVRDCYHGNVNNMKKSGYFASRIVSSIVLYALFTDPILQPDPLFAVIRSTSGTARDAYLTSLGTSFAERIGEALRYAANRANLVYESSYAGLALLGTTLCTAVCREEGGILEVLLLTAGDSRPYVWTEAGGLCQLLPDEEGTDGGMTNYIRANDGANFSIRCHYMTFQTPCILFCASDGCFDSGSFLSPLAFETLLMDALSLSETPQAAETYLTDAFASCGRHDDSSTIAMGLYGWQDFDAVRQSVRRRIDALDQTYFSAMPDLLTAEYRSADTEAFAQCPAFLRKQALQHTLFETYEAAYSRYIGGTNE